jgi:nucleotide-binding universal stress UspA family protein
MFERVVCGVDGSAESLEAVRQADVALEPGGRLVLVSVVDLSDTIHFQIAPTAIHAARRALARADELDRETVDALEAARGAVRHAADLASVQAAGPPSSALVETVVAEHAGLAVVGTHGRGRIAGIALGSVATRMLHRAPCSVLVARQGVGDWAPGTIVVGVDASPEADAALEAAEALRVRFGSTLTSLEIEGRRPAHGLIEAARGADLLVVGSRGTHGARSLGSVSERVAHEAPCSVLVVRPALPA